MRMEAATSQSTYHNTPKRKQQGTLFSFMKPKATTAPAEEPKGSKRKTSNAGLDNKPDVKKSPSASAALKKKIVLKWKDEFPWLTIRKEDDGVICSVCIQVPKEAGNMQFITGCKSEKKKTFQIHAKSNGHLRTRTALLSQQKPVRKTMLVQSFSKATKDLDERDRKEVAVKMTTAYFVAKEEPPFSKFNPLISLQKKEWSSTNVHVCKCEAVSVK